MTPLRLVYSTCASMDEACRIGRSLVEERLAACSNAIPGMRSCYRWQGRICDEEETVLILKTREELVEPLIARLRALHGYQVPCALSLAIERGNPDYLAWLLAETGPAGGESGAAE